MEALTTVNMSERYEIATFFELHNHGAAGTHRLTVDNYGKGTYMINHVNASHTVDPGEPFTEALPPSLIRFVQAITKTVSASNSFTYDGQMKINYQFIKDLYLLQDVAKEMRKKEEELEKEYQRRIKLYKEDFQAELDEARKIIQMNKISNPVVNEEQPKPPMSPIITAKQKAQQQALGQNYRGSSIHTGGKLLAMRTLSQAEQEARKYNLRGYLKICKKCNSTWDMRDRDNAYNACCNCFWP